MGDNVPAVPAEDELAAQCRHQLEVHKVPVTPGAIAACRTLASGYIAIAEDLRDLLGRLVHAIDGTVLEHEIPTIRPLLDEAYELGVPEIELDEGPVDPSGTQYKCADCGMSVFVVGGEPFDPERCIDCAIKRKFATAKHVRSQFADFARRVASGEQPDDAAVAAGGTGRPR